MSGNMIILIVAAVLVTLGEAKGRGEAFRKQGYGKSLLVEVGTATAAAFVVAKIYGIA